MEGSTLVTLALNIAIQAHKDQFRRDGKTPYIEHPKAVAEQFKEPRLRALAYLHDVIEDSNISLTTLKELGIPQNILDSLNRLTKRKLESYADYILSCLYDPDARAVKIEDIKHNLLTSSGNQKAKYELALYILEKGGYDAC